MRAAHRGVVFESVSTHVLQKRLETRDLNNAIRTEGVEGVVSESAFGHIGFDLASEVIGRDSSERKRTSRGATDGHPVRTIGPEYRP